MDSAFMPRDRINSTSSDCEGIASSIHKPFYRRRIGETRTFLVVPQPGVVMPFRLCLDIGCARNGNSSKQYISGIQVGGETVMIKKTTKRTTRRGFVKEVAAGTTVAAAAGVFATGCSPQVGNGSVSLEARIEALEKRIQQGEDVQAINRLQ
jgi:hypothetical protein